MLKDISTITAIVDLIRALSLAGSLSQMVNYILKMICTHVNMFYTIHLQCMLITLKTNWSCFCSPCKTYPQKQLHMNVLAYSKNVSPWYLNMQHYLRLRYYIWWHSDIECESLLWDLFFYSKENLFARRKFLRKYKRIQVYIGKEGGSNSILSTEYTSVCDPLDVCILMERWEIAPALYR